MTKNILTVTSRFPDAYCRKYAALLMVIRSPLLGYRLSGFFHTEEEAWKDAAECVNKHDLKKVNKLIHEIHTKTF